MGKIAVRLAFLLCIASALFAQEGAGRGIVIYAEGSEFTVRRGSTLLSFDVWKDDVFGLELAGGDLIQTEAGTFLEIQILPSGTLVKVAENTTLQLSGIGSEGSGAFSLTYGRVRAKVDGILGKKQFSIQGRSVVAGVRGTDFGYDILVLPDSGTGRPVTNVYSFEGEVEVSGSMELDDTASTRAQESEAAGEAGIDPSGRRTLVIRGNEMVTVQQSGAGVAGGKPVVMLGGLSSGITTFWASFPFLGTPQPIDRPSPVQEDATQATPIPAPLQSEPAVPEPPADSPSEPSMAGVPRAVVADDPPEPLPPVDPEEPSAAAAEEEPDPEPEQKSEPVRTRTLPDPSIPRGAYIGSGIASTILGGIIGSVGLFLAFADESTLSDIGLPPSREGGIILSSIGGLTLSLGIYSMITGFSAAP